MPVTVEAGPRTAKPTPRRRPVALIGRTLYYKAWWDETRRMKCFIHGADSPDITASQESKLHQM
jgi:hypothetical protein